MKNQHLQEEFIRFEHWAYPTTRLLNQLAFQSPRCSNGEKCSDSLPHKVNAQ